MPSSATPGEAVVTGFVNRWTTGVRTSPDAISSVIYSNMTRHVMTIP